MLLNKNDNTYNVDKTLDKNGEYEGFFGWLIKP